MFGKSKKIKELQEENELLQLVRERQAQEVKELKETIATLREEGLTPIEQIQTGISRYPLRINSIHVNRCDFAKRIHSLDISGEEPNNVW